MKLVKQLKEELNKFDDLDLCYVYEGEVTGIIVKRGNKRGVIFCSESRDTKDTILIPKELEF